jgi:AcrR family transcriptional regulator
MTTRGRPRQFDRDQALETAMRLFRQHGYEGTSVSFLGDKMGINTPSLYAAFGSKDELYQEAVSLYLNKTVMPMVSAMSASGNAREGMRTFLRECAQVFTNQPEGVRGCMILNGDLVYAPSHQSRADDMSRKRCFAEDAIRARLERAQQETELPPDTDTRALAAYFSVLVQGLSVRSHDQATVEDLYRVIDTAMNVWPGGHH